MTDSWEYILAPFTEDVVIPKTKTKSVNDPQQVGRRPGFVVKLHGEHFKAMHIAYVWYRSQGMVFPPEVDNIVSTLIPSMEKLQGTGCGWRSLRIRAKDVQPMIDFLDKVTELPFGCAYTMRSRAQTLKKIDVNDLLADAGR